MKKAVLNSILFILLACNGFAQFMNMRGWNKTERDSLEHALQLLEEKKHAGALPIFESILSHHPNEEFLKYSFAKCALWNPDKQTEAYKQLSQIYEKNKKVADIHYYLALGAYYNGNYDEALNLITACLASKRVHGDVRKNAELQKKYIQHARYYFTHPTRGKLFNMGKAFNSEFNESHPLITANELQFMYAQSASTTTNLNSSVTAAIRLNRNSEGELTETKTLKQSIESASCIPLALNSDGTKLFVCLARPNDAGDIFEAGLVNDSLSEPQKLKGDVNSPFCESACSLSPDGHTLYFSSNRPGGKGGKDIYRATLLGDSLWTNVVNLGDSVNTPLDEESPFIHADGKTLFFSSQGHANVGGFDVFKTSMHSKDSTFKKSENLGYPINSPGDELDFVLSASAENAYFSSNRREGNGGFDLYHVEPNFKSFKPSLCLFSGKVFKNEQPVQVLITIEAGAPGKKRYVNTIRSNAHAGDYLVALPTGTEYQLTYQLPNYKPKSVTIDLADMLGFVEKIKNIHFDALMDSIKVNPKPLSTISSASAVNNTSLSTTSPTNTYNLGTNTKTRLPVADTTGKPLTPAPESGITTVASATTAPETKSTNLVATLSPTSGAIIPVVNSSTTNALSKAGTSIKKDEPLVVTDNKTLTAVKPTNDSLKKSLATTNPTTQKMADTINIKTLPQPADSSNKKTTSFRSDIQKNNGTPAVVSNPPSATITAASASNSTLATKPKVHHVTDDFEPNTATQEKMMANAYKYGEISYDSLEFRVQVSAYKNNAHYFFPKLEKFGKIEKVELGDGYKRLMIGGSFKTYGRAFSYAKKVIKAGHDDVFIVVVYKGYRYSVEDLEEVGIFK